MFKPALRSLLSMVVMAIIAVGVYYWAQTSYVDIPWKAEKQKAANIMQNCMNTLKDEVVKRNYEINENTDPAATGLVGPYFSTITTGPGLLEDRQTALNPNVAAVVVDRLKRADLKAGDWVAVTLSGTNPGMNLAVYSAIEALKLHPITITSVGSAQYGASRPDFTWLDMETILYNSGKISFKSYLASIGGGSDIGRGLGNEGLDTIKKSISNNGVSFLNEENIDKNVEARMAAFDKALPKGSEYKLYINIGASLPNVGSLVSAKVLNLGPSNIVAKNTYSNKRVIDYFNDRKVPYVHFHSTSKLAQRKAYKLPIAPEKTPEVGTGGVFEPQKNDVTVAAIALAIILVVMTLVIYLDRRHRHFTRHIVNHDKEF